jgi:sirohydrochlorin ferrochelatase
MKPGILVISHGSQEKDWVSLVDKTVQSAQAELGNQVLIEAAFLELVEGRLIQDGISRLEAAEVTDILALPLFVSSGSTHVDEIGWALGAYPESRTETDLERFRIQSQLTYGSPMDTDQEVIDVLLDRLKMLSRQPNKESIILIAHGSKVEGFQQAWQKGLDEIGKSLIKQGGYAAYSSAMLQLDEVTESYELLREEQFDNDLLAIPLFLSEGYFTKRVIPRQLVGLDCRYDGSTLMPHIRVTDWIVRRSQEWLMEWNNELNDRQIKGD